MEIGGRKESKKKKGGMEGGKEKRKPGSRNGNQTEGHGLAE